MTNLKAENLHLKYELKKLENDFQQLVELNKQVIAENKTLRKENIALKEENAKLKLKVSKLEKKVEQLSIKSNQPSSKKADYEKEESKPSLKKRGRKGGYVGISRKTPKKIDKEVHYSLFACPDCNSTNLESRKTRSRVITDIIIKRVNIKEIFHDKTCKDCNCKLQAESPNGNSKSPFGKGVHILHTYLKNIGGMTLRPLENFFQDICKLKITDSSISNNGIRIANNGINEYNSYLEMIKKDKLSHKDETTWRINGKIHYVWVYDSLNTVFYRLADTRAMSVLENDFGKSCKQISINDNYGAYISLFENQQNCFAHPLREVEDHAKKANATDEEKRFNIELKAIYKIAKDFVAGDPPPEKRRKKRVELENELCELMLSLKNKTDFLRRICNRFSDNLTNFFLFVEVPGLPSTNNQAERSLRPLVVHRKTSFGSHSFEGGNARMIIKTLIENAKRKEKSILEVIENLLFSSVADT